MPRMNLNDCVSFQLTTYGEAVYRKHWEKLLGKYDHMEAPSLTILENGLVEMQLWEVAHIFGPYLYNGANQIFETNILNFEISVLQ